jgi:hypothetical protein
MKNILLVNLFLITMSSSFIDNCKERYSIQVWDYDYSMAYTTFYKIDGESVTVKAISGIKNEKDSILMQRPISENECEMMLDFLSSHNIERFKDKYSNPMVDDGDRKKVVFDFKGKSRTVEIANFYQKDMGEMFDVINKIVNKDLQIKYKRPS